MSALENPPAFPSVCRGDPDHPASIPGMSLRDYFAGQALAPMITAAINGQLVEAGDGADNERLLAAQAYAFADAMLAARKTGGAA